MMLSKENITLSVLLFLIIFMFAWWSHPSLIPKTYPDSFAYVNIAENFNHKSNAMRPFVFPLFTGRIRNV